ncbi:alpha/beta fold hydrolase [Streptosporangium soli]|nr:alpha/beta fold hydrolase [Streptosporangium sp. KLBMP 9127]
MRVTTVIGPGLTAGPESVGELADRESAALGVTGRVLTAPDVTALAAALGTAVPEEALVVLPGPEPAARELMAGTGPHTGRTVWLDLHRTGPVPVAKGSAHLYGRGLAGVTWAVRHAVHRLRVPARRIAYGGHLDQWADLRLPAPPGEPPGDPMAGPFDGRVGGPPVVVLLHGGYWRSIWGADLMDALAIDLAGRGLAVWNLEYRRPDLHGWAATTADVAAGIAAVARAGLERGPLVLLGHSAGGQLAFRAAADEPGRVALAVSLAGVLDLVEAERRFSGAGAVEGALGGTADALPDVYAAASPITRLPLGVPQLVVQGAGDDPDLVDTARRYARAAGAAAVHLERPGDHFAVIDPSRPVWRETAELIIARLAG